MKRNLIELADRRFDLLVVGGGIYGAWVVWDAALRGMSVALVERGDFGGETSSNNFKLVHGGLRYLQHLDLKRMRESIREQRTLRRVAPHLVTPIPCLVPTYGHGMKSRSALRCALLLNDLISADRNRGVPAGRALPGRRFLSPDEVRERVPGIPTEGLTGGAVWHDAQMKSPDRLLISLIRSAAGRGATVANYAEARRLLVDGDRVRGAEVRDGVSGDTFEVQAAVTINAAGPWADTLLGTLRRSEPLCPPTQAWNLVLNRLLFSDYAVGLYGRREFRDRDRRISSGGRLIFFAPWRGRTLIGTAHQAAPADRHPDMGRDRESCLDFLREAAEAYPEADLTESDLAFAHCGVLPGTADPATGDVCLAKHYQLRDHSREDGVAGLLSAAGVKFTTARDVAERLVNLAARQLESSFDRCRTAETPIQGGDIPDWNAFRAEVEAKLPETIPPPCRVTLCENYGREILSLVESIAHPRELEPLAEGAPTIELEVMHAVRSEMALKLADVVRRRTELGSAGLAHLDALRRAADIMAAELGWSPRRREAEIAETLAIYEPFLPAHFEPSATA